jgi:predicted small lipoprotein YifL
LKVFFALAALGFAAFGLASCGRVGPLDLPPGPAVAQPAPTASAAPPGGPVASGPSPQEAAQKNGFDIYSNPVAPPGAKKSFPLDPLLQ